MLYIPSTETIYLYLNATRRVLEVRSSGKTHPVADEGSYDADFSFRKPSPTCPEGGLPVFELPALL